MTILLLRKLTRIVLIVMAVLVTFVAGTAGLTLWESSRDRILPTPTGPHAVGRRSFAWLEDRPIDPISSKTSAQRDFFVWAWYPATRDPDAKVAQYLPQSWFQAYRRKWYEQRLDRVHSHAIEGAPISGAQETFPVLVFSPGAGQLPTHYTALIEDLASHGYIILAAAHSGDTPIVVFPDGRVIRAGAKKEPLERVRILATDLVSVVGHITNERAKKESFFSHLSAQQIGVFGHSLGGTAALEACGMDARFKACVDLDGVVYGDVVMKGVQQPIFLMGSPSPPPISGILDEDMLLARSAISYRLNVGHLSHMNFSDKGFFFDAEDRLTEVTGARLDASETVRLASTYTRAFFDQYLLGVQTGLDHVSSPNLRMEVHLR